MNIVAPERSTCYSNRLYHNMQVNLLVLSKTAVRNHISQHDLVSEWTFTAQS